MGIHNHQPVRSSLLEPSKSTESKGARDLEREGEFSPGV